MVTKSIPSIFLVDDDKVFLSALSHRLKQEDEFHADIKSFSSGEECIQNLILRPQIIVLDYYLNSDCSTAMNGLETLKKIKDISPDIDVIMLSSQNDMGITVEVMKCGAYDYVSKSRKTFSRIKDAIANTLISKAKKEAYSPEGTNVRKEDFNHLVYHMSHDFREPLVTTLGVLNLAKKEIKDKQALRYFNMIGKSNEKLDFLLLSFNKIQSINLCHLQKIKIDFQKILSNSVKSANENRITQTQIRISPDFKNDFFSDETLMYYLFQSLILNAISYKETEISNVVSLTRNKENLVIEFFTWNMTIPPEFQDKIFDMFFRLKPWSTGLELYLVKKIVQKLGGQVQLSDEPMKGTVFTIMLPYEPRMSTN